MATYQRKIGQNDVFETSDPNNPRYVSFDEANKNNIWGSVQNIPRQENYGLGSTPKPAPYQDFMKTWLEGYGKKQQTLTGVQKQISDVENLLGSLEKDIKSRTQDYLVTQAQRNRQIASEGAPLREQYAGLLKGQSAVESSLAGEREMLPYMKEFLEYESPADKAKRTYSESMREYEDKLKLEQKYATPKETATPEPTQPETTTATSWTQLGKLGITRRVPESGIGYSFYYNGKPITYQEIMQKTGAPISLLLSGSTNPADKKLLGGATNTATTATNSDDLFNNL